MQQIGNAVGYCRVSTGDQTTVNQVDRLKEVGVTILFRDEGISGTREALERPEYRRMMKYLKEHEEVKTIAVWELSRLGRNLQDSINTFLNIEKDGYRVISLSESWTQQQDPAMRSLMILIVSWMNEQELVRISGRVKAGMDRAKLHGTKSGKMIGRPTKTPDFETVEQMRSIGKGWKEISSIFHIEPCTLFRYRQKWKREKLAREISK